MQILCVDVGTGTQDILLFDSDREIENCVQIIAPSPTRIVADRIRRATARGKPIVLTGRTMGGGPCGWAAEDHLRNGLPVFATPDAARTFDDELLKVERMGVQVVTDEDAARLPGVERVVMGDLDLAAITDALARFDVDVDLAAIAVAVFDHGNAPPGVSDRTFRFEYIAETVAQNDLTAFAYRRESIPARLTRMRAVASDTPPDVPALVMDTGPAAIVGALEDPIVRSREHALIANLGNFHTLAFHLDAGQVRGIFEHHTGELTRDKLERYLGQLADGSLSNADVFADMGHGALVVGVPSARPDLFAVTGPRRSLLNGSSIRTYLAVPHGDMMLAGCFGLLRAVARRMPDLAAPIEARLGALD